MEKVLLLNCVLLKTKQKIKTKAFMKKVVYYIQIEN